MLDDNCIIDNIEISSIYPEVKIYEVKVKLTAQKVTDEEIQAYLQLHPNVIKDAIAKERA